MQTIPLWPVMFYDFQWSQHQQYQQDLKDVCYELEKKNHVSNVAPDAKRGLYESGFDFVSTPHPAVEAFSHWIKNCFFQAASNVNKPYWPAGLNVSVEVHESWCHITRSGGYHDMHVHPMSSWSAIYYVDIGDMNPDSKNGVNRFFSPHENMYMDAGTAYMSGKNSIDFRAEPGMLIVFPSWVRHSATTYTGKKDRIVIAANCRINRTDLSQVSIATV
jgi:uncharacterized protein (TIGR02466 family)